MTPTTTVRILPRVALTGYLRVLRLALTAVERVAGQTGNQAWPPALAFESFEASVETTLGSLLGDAALADKGRLRQAKLAQLRTAGQLDTLAAQERTEADRTLQSRREQTTQQRHEVQARATQRNEQFERQADARERQVQQRAAKKTAAVRRTKAIQDKTVDRRERAAKTTALTAESRALATARDALDADRTIDAIDDAIDGTKAARKSG
jgi:hypothetical protein